MQLAAQPETGLAGLRRRLLHNPFRRGGADRRRFGPLLLGVQLLYLALFAAWLVESHTWPAPDVVVLGLLVFAVLSARGLSFLRDWTPFLILMLAYVALAGEVPGLVQRAHVGFPITVDRWLGLGELPTTRLQRWLWDPRRSHWYDYVTAALYFLHFITPLAFAFLLWLRRRAQYWRFVSAYLLLMYAGFATYLIYPMAPPWWASNLGRVPAVQPVLASVQWHSVTNPVVLLSRYFHTDPVAAMPSMHAAFPVLVWLVVWRLFPRWGRLAVVYPVAMGIAVVYAGEHYLIDVLVGALYAAVAYAVFWEAAPQHARALARRARAVLRQRPVHEQREGAAGRKERRAGPGRCVPVPVEVVADVPAAHCSMPMHGDEHGRLPSGYSRRWPPAPR